MTHPVTIEYILESKTYPRGAKGYIHVFFPRYIVGAGDARAEIVNGVPGTIVLSFPAKIPQDTLVLVHWGMERVMYGDNHADVGPSTDISTRLVTSRAKPQLCRVFAGHAYMTVDDIERHQTVPVIDIVGVTVGSIVLKITAVEEKTVIVGLPTKRAHHPTDVTEITSIFTNEYLQYKRRIPELKESNIDYLPFSHFTEITLPVGKVPMISFVLELYHTRRAKDEMAESMLLGLMAIAGPLLMSLSDAILPSIVDGTAPRALVAELIGQMCIAPTRHMLYVRDSSKRLGGEPDAPTDEWSRLGHQRYRRRDLAGMDCEDGTSEAMEIFLCLRNGTFKDRILIALQKFARNYAPMFCIGAIRLGTTGHTYHAFLLLIDGTVLNKATSPRSQTKVQNGGDGKYPPILCESTTRATCCWEYDRAKGGKDKYLSMHHMEPIEGLTNIPSDLIQEQGIYRHIVTGFAVDGRYDFIQDGKSGARISDVMLGRGVYSVQGYVNKDELRVGGVFRQMYANMPPLRPIAEEESTVKVGYTTRVIGTPRHLRLVLDGCYRYADWTSEIAEEIMKLSGASCMEVSTVNLPAGQRGIVARGWA